MVWAGFCREARTPLCFISTRMDSVSYCQMLQEYLIPFTRHTFTGEYTFQQDNAPCHRARNTIQWLTDHGIKVMEWPALSPDLNPIENLWGILARKVYSGGKQYETTAELKEAILRAWAEIDERVICALVSSMQQRMIDIIKSEGNAINY